MCLYLIELSKNCKNNGKVEVSSEKSTAAVDPQHLKVECTD